MGGAPIICKVIFVVWGYAVNQKSLFSWSLHFNPVRDDELLSQVTIGMNLENNQGGFPSR